MIHITPPMMVGAPAIDQIGVGDDPEWAVSELAQSPYPGCRVSPTCTRCRSPVAARSTFSSWCSWETVLGCDPAKFHNQTIEDFSNMIPIISTSNSMDQPPNWHPIGWGPDYPDANNYVNDILGCKADNAFTSRPCSAIDDLILQARQETDLDTRKADYAQIEEMYFGREARPGRADPSGGGLRAVPDLPRRPIETDGLVGPEHYDFYTIDKQAQSANRSQ